MKNVEKKLNPVGEEPITIAIVLWGKANDKLPPDWKEENITYHYVAYEDIVKK